MSTLYKTVAGDTFDLIARKNYGSELEVGKIINANPGVSEPLVPDITIVIPTPSTKVEDQEHFSATDLPDEVSLYIGGKRYRFWENITINSSIDSIDTIEFITPFDHEIPGFTETFKPLSFKSMSVIIGGEKLFNGTMVGINPVLNDSSRIISITGYSMPGVLNDCTPSLGSPEKLEHDGMTIEEIAKDLASSFGVDVEINGNIGAKFDRVSCKYDQTVLSYLINLAKQRNLIITNTPNGKLLLQQSLSNGDPVAKLKQGESPLLSVTVNTNPQSYYSHITGHEPIVVGSKGSTYTVKNDRLKGIVRPYNFEIPDTNGADVVTVVKAKAGRMFGGVVSYSVDVSTWRDSNGNLWKPNTFISLIAPDAMIYNEYKFLIKSVSYNQESTNKTAVLELVLPESFNGNIPESLPWD